MTTRLDYIPDIGIKLNSTTLNWLTTRDNVRNLLNLPYTVADNVIDIGENETIESKRDVYQNINGDENYIFLNYNADNLLNEVEVHWGVDIFVKDIVLNFNNHIQDNINALKKLTGNYREIEPGNYLFKDLKLTIADSESCGGDGNELSYFYATTDITHLDE